MALMLCQMSIGQGVEDLKDLDFPDAASILDKKIEAERDKHRKKVIKEHADKNPGKPPLTPEQIKERVDKRTATYTAEIERAKDKLKANQIDNKAVKDKLRNMEKDVTGDSDDALLLRAQRLQEKLERDSQANAQANKFTQPIPEDLITSSENLINNLPALKDIKDLKNIIGSAKQLSVLADSFNEAEKMFDVMQKVPGGSGKLPNQSLALFQLAFKPPFVFPAFSIIKGKDEVTRKYMKSIRNSAMLRSIGMVFTENAVADNVVRYEDRLKNQYTKSKYDKKTGFKSGAIKRAVDLIISEGLSKELDKKGFGITKNKKEMADHFKLNDIAIIGALTQAVDVKKMTPAQRQEIYRLRRNLMRQLGENGRVSRDQLLIPTVKYMVENPTKGKKLKKLVDALEPFY